MRIGLLFIVSLTFLSLKGDFFESGKASYYANAFEGRKTSSGEVFRQKLLTGAHKSLPFGTVVEVKNLSNDSIVVLKINDRLPQRSSRVIDVSTSAAKQLNFIRAGIANVELRIVTPEVEEEVIPATEAEE